MNPHYDSSLARLARQRQVCVVVRACIDNDAKHLLKRYVLGELRTGAVISGVAAVAQSSRKVLQNILHNVQDFDLAVGLAD